MQNITYTHLRANLANKMQQVCEDHMPILITRSNAEPVIMMSLEAIEETHYLLQSPVNASRLAESINEVEAMIAKQKTKKPKKK